MNESVSLSRPEYDALVTRFPEWMKTSWHHLERSWHLGGVTVRRDDDEASTSLAFRALTLELIPAIRTEVPCRSRR